MQNPGKHASHNEEYEKTVKTLDDEASSGSQLTALKHSLGLLHQFESKHKRLSSQGNAQKRLAYAMEIYQSYSWINSTNRWTRPQFNIAYNWLKKSNNLRFFINDFVL